MVWLSLLLIFRKKYSRIKIPWLAIFSFLVTHALLWAVLYIAFRPTDDLIVIYLFGVPLLDIWILIWIFSTWIWANSKVKP